MSPWPGHASREAGDWLELGLLQRFVIHLITNSSRLLQWQDEIAALSAPSWAQRRGAQAYRSSVTFFLVS